MWDKLQYQSDLTSNEHAAILNSIRDRMQFDRVTYVEVGVFFGGTFKLVLENFHKQIDIIGIDLFEDYRENSNSTHIGATANKEVLELDLKSRGFTDFHLIKAESLDGLLSLNGIKNGVVFIDGSHTYKATMLDFLSAYIKVESGDFIFHNSSNNWAIDVDYCSRDGGPFRVVQEIVAHLPLQLMGRHDRSTVIRK